MVFRALGWVLLAMAVAAIVHDALTWWTGGSFHLLGLGDLWSHLDVRSLGDVQAAIQRHLSSALWTWVVRPVLMVPALPAFVVLGLLFLCRQSQRASRADTDRLAAVATSAAAQPRRLS